MDYLNKFEAYLEKEKNVSSTTLSAYMADLAEFEVFIKERSKVLEKAGNADVAAFLMNLQHQGRSNSTINRKLASVRSFYTYMISDGRVNHDPTFNIKPPKVVRKELEFLSVEEINKLLDAPDDSVRGLRDKALLELMYATGLRASEICDANVDDIDFRIGYINVKSDKKPRVVPIGKPARAALKVYLEKSRKELLEEKEDSKALFLSYLGDRLTRQGIWKILKFYSDKLEFKHKLSPQLIRNSFAAHLIQNGADLKSLQELLGHEDIMATKIYLSVSKNRIMDVYDRAFPRA